MKHKMPILILLLLLLAETAASSAPLEFYFVDLAGQGYTSASLHGSPVVLYVGSTS